MDKGWKKTEWYLKTIVIVRPRPSPCLIYLLEKTIEEHEKEEQEQAIDYEQLLNDDY